jgi:hypothetical protein
VFGRLKTDATGRFLPKKGDDAALSGVDLANDAHVVPDNQLFAAGDRRANETVSLASLHTLFMREHNRLADQFHRANPSLNDEQIYQMARRRVGAEMQVIVYQEYIPALLGPNALPAYTGFNPNVNAGIKTEFSTIFFRFGHSQLDNDVERTDGNGNTIGDGKLDLAKTFFDAPNVLGPGSSVDPVSGNRMTDIDPILKGGGSAISQNVDQFCVTDIRNALFGPFGAGGEDLCARDYQRARDHAIPNLNALRQAYGVPALTAFRTDATHVGITRNATLAATISAIFGGDINNVDGFVGAICEDHASGASVGPTTKASLIDQFRRLRDGDRFFFLGPTFTAAEQSDLLRTTSLAKLINRNTGVTNLQGNIFFLKDSIAGNAFIVNPDGTTSNLTGATINLKDDSGAIIATKRTDANGHYRFQTPGDFASTGAFNVSVVPPAGFAAVVGSVDMQISKGDINVQGVNLTVVRTAAPTGGKELFIAPSPFETPSGPDAQPAVIATEQLDAFFVTTGLPTATTTTQTADDGSGAVVGGLGHEAPAAQDDVVVNDLAQL